MKKKISPRKPLRKTFDSDGLTIGLDDLKVLFQSKWFYGSVISINQEKKDFFFYPVLLSSSGQLNDSDLLLNSLGEMLLWPDRSFSSRS